MADIYILECEGGKYYVGKSQQKMRVLIPLSALTEQ
jgi:predicted GIY-YIG superfamily endonuclease